MLKVYTKAFCFLLLISSIYGRDCKKNTDCNSENFCKMNADGDKGTCYHNSVFPMGIRIVFGLIIILIFAGLSNSGGIGGGGLFIPILILILGFYSNQAFPISNLMIFTGSFASFFLGFRTKHPLKESVCVDYNIAYQLIPFMLFGTLVGVDLNTIMPPVVTLICLTAVLGFNSYKGIQKFRQIFKKETQEKKEKLEKEKMNAVQGLIPENERISKLELNTVENRTAESNDKENPLLGADNQDLRSKIPVADGHIATEEDLLMIQKEIEKDKRRIPIDKYIFYFVALGFEYLITFLRGSQTIDSFVGVKICSAGYWLIYSAYIPIVLLLTLYASWRINNEYKHRKKIGYKFLSCDIKWEMSIFLRFPVFAFITGVLSGFLGIGGGLIIGPLLLTLGVHPAVSTATSNFMVVFTSFSTATQFMLAGLMDYSFGLACLIASTIGSIFGTILLQKLVKITGRFSILVLVLVIVLLMSAFAVPGYSIYEIVVDVQDGKSVFKFSSICDKSS